jgi:ATP-binding cassette subfamily C (CFTR/MRP) protein 1
LPGVDLYALCPWLPFVLTVLFARLLASFRKVYESELASSGTRPLVTTLWKLATPTFVPAAFCQLLTVLCQAGVPLLVRELLTLLEDKPNQKVLTEGLPFCLGLCFALFLNAFGNHRHRHLAMKTGVIMRAALINVLYARVLRLSPQGRSDLTTGEVTTLVAVDTQKLYEVTQEANLIWSLPLSVVLVTIFLILVMGPVTLIGIAILILFVPMASFVTNKMLQVRQARVKATDRRIEISSSMLQGIKTAKLNNYEASYLEQASAVRYEELRLLRQELAIWAVTLMMTVISPVLATAGTFAVYVLVDEDNILTAAKSFSVLLLFSALRFPVNYAGRLLGKAAQAVSALRRIEHFLDRDIRSTATIHEKSLPTVEEAALDDEKPLLVVTKAAFRVGEDTLNEVPIGDTLRGGSFTVSEFDFSVRRGEIMAVCGPVGSGKSTLINGMINEATPLSKETTVSKKGRVAYVPQTPFILNATLRDNILFGLPFDQAHYDRVLDACALRSDIVQLGAAGDLTEIGERGVTLSGGKLLELDEV